MSSDRRNRKPGRPPRGEAAAESFTLRLTPAERAAIAGVAAELGVAPAELIRTAALQAAGEGAALLSLEAGALREASLALGPIARALAQHDAQALARVAAEVEALRTALRRLCAAAQVRGRRTRERLAP